MGNLKNGRGTQGIYDRAAKVYHADKEMGTLEEGKLANLIVLSDNLFEIPTEQIEDTKVVVNIFEGKEIYAV